MSNKILYIVDVFTQKKYAGNQLAVVRNAGNLSSEEMQEIAREMHFSETTFIISEKEQNNEYPVRIFTLNEEVPFAGHPTLGTAYIIQQEIIKKPVEKIVLNLKAGKILVTFNYSDNKPDEIWMKQLEPKFIKTINIEQISEMLKVDKTDIDERFPAQEVSTGTPFIIVPLKSLAAVRKAVLNREVYFNLIEKLDSKAVFFFTSETQEKGNHIHARLFADYYGVTEDPATGSAAGCLAGYLVKYRYFGKNQIDVRVEQGHEINRPSLLYLKADETKGKINIHVGGKVILVVRGELV